MEAAASVLASSRKKRRDSTRILYEILLASKNGVSKTKAVYASKLNFRLIEEYLDFLLKMRYLERMPSGPSHDELRLTVKGTHLLGLLDELEKEIKPFRSLGVRTGTRAITLGHERKAFVHAEAIRALKKARELSFKDKISRKDHEYQISLALLQVYALQGLVSDEAAEIELVISLARSLSDKSKLAEAHVWKSNHLTRVGKYTEAMLEGRKALGFAERSRDELKIAAAELAIGEAGIFLGQKDEPLRNFLAALRCYESYEDRVGQANAARLIAQAHLSREGYSRALDYANRALDLFRTAGDRFGEDETLRYLGDICCARGDYLQGLNYYEQVLKIRRETGNRSREGGALGDIGDVYLSLGQYEKSLEFHRQALAIDREVGYLFGQVWDHHDLGVTQFYLGNLAMAREELGEALVLAKEIKAPDLITLCQNDLSRTLRSLGGGENLKDALESASDASSMGEEFSLLSVQVLGESNVAMAHRALGDWRKALDHSERAVKLLHNSGPLEVREEEILFNHFLVLQDNNRTDEAGDFLKMAHDRMASKAGRIKDFTTRETFLSRVAINREIRDAWKDQMRIFEPTIAR